MFPPRSPLPFLALLIVVAAPIGIRVIRGGATPDKVRVPEFDLRELPLELVRWRGEESQLDLSSSSRNSPRPSSRPVA